MDGEEGVPPSLKRARKFSSPTLNPGSIGIKNCDELSSRTSGMYDLNKSVIESLARCSLSYRPEVVTFVCHIFYILHITDRGSQKSIIFIKILSRVDIIFFRAFILHRIEYLLSHTYRDPCSLRKLAVTGSPNEGGSEKLDGAWPKAGEPQSRFRVYPNGAHGLMVDTCSPLLIR